jgi:cellulose synthase operon protein C
MRERADAAYDPRTRRKALTNVHFLYERIYREAPTRTDVGRKLVAVTIELGRTADALVHAERLLKEFPNDGELLGRVAECQVAQNKPTEARATFERAITCAPDNVGAHLRYARLLENHFRQPKEARDVLDRMIRANAARPFAFLMRADFLKRHGQNDECLRDLDRVLLLDPENAEALVVSAELYQARGDLRRARETLRDAVATYPHDVRGYRSLAWLELLSGNQAAARAALEAGIARVPDAPDLLTPLADQWIEQGEFDRVADVIRKLETRKDAAQRVSYLRGRLAMKQGKWSEALAIFDAQRTEAVAQPVVLAQLNLLIAGCHERRGDREAQVESLKRVLATDPNHLAARVALANSYLTAGRIEDAIKEYQLAARSPYAGLGVHVTFLSLRIAAARLSDAPAQEWTAIAGQLTKVRSQHPLAVEPIVLTAEALAARGDFAAAEKVLRDATTRQPHDARLWAALAACTGRGQGTLAAAAVVSEGQLATSDTVDMRLARARVWAEDSQPGRAQRVARLEELPTSAGDPERVQLLAGLADTYSLIRDDAGRKRVLEAIAAKLPADVGTRAALLALSLKDGDAAAQARWRDELKRLDATGRTGAVVEALHLVRKSAGADRRLAEWQELSRAALNETPDSPDAVLLAARLAERAGDNETATKLYERAVALDVPALPAQEARLAFFLRSGQDEAARRTIARLEADPRLTYHRVRAVVEGALSDAGPDALGKCLQWMQGSLKREPRAAVWAGRLLEARGKVSDAIAFYTQANEAVPAFADAWSARLLAAARLGEAETMTVTNLAAKALPKKAFFTICAETGAAVRAKVPTWSPPVQTAEDQKAYAQACIAACEARGRLEDAVPVLKAMSDNPDTPKADAAWAKQTIAALTAALGTPEEKQNALNTLRSADAPTAAGEVRTRLNALGIALRSAGGDDRRAVVHDMIRLLTGLVQDPSATSNDWFQLAQLYRVAGDRANCRKCLEELTKREPNNLVYAAARLDDLLGDNSLAAARPLAEKIAAGTPDFRGLSSAARYLTLTNQAAQVLDLIEKYVRAVDPGTADAAVRQRQTAELLDQLTRLSAGRGLSGYQLLLDGAAERYRAAYRAYPEAAVPLAGLLAFDGRVQPALDELERHKSRLSSTALAAGGVAVLRSGRANATQFQTVKGWIDDGLKAEPKAVALRLSLAEVHALQQDFTNAEQVYREVLKVEPKNPVALNNLAWILAPRPDAAGQAMAFADRAIELYGASGEMLDTRARILIAAGKYDRALADLKDALNQSPSPLRYFHLALAQWKMDRPEEAVKAFREARARGLDAKAVHPSDLPTFQALETRMKG